MDPPARPRVERLSAASGREPAEQAMAALEKFFAAAGLKPQESKLYATKCDSEGYDVGFIAEAAVDDLVTDLGMKRAHARAVLRHCASGAAGGGGGAATPTLLAPAVE